MYELLLLTLVATAAQTVLSGGLSQFPSSVMVHSGDPVRMSCHLNAVKAYCYTVAWMKVNPDWGTLAISNDIAVLWGQNFTQSTECPAAIQSTTAEDSGTYYCAVTDKQRIYIGNGTRVFVKERSSTAPSVEVAWYPSSSSLGSAVPVQCLVRGVVPSQVEVDWMIGARRERAKLECLRARGDVYTVSQTLVWPGECSRGEECTCVVKHEGHTFNKTLKPNDVQESCYAVVSPYRASALIASLLIFISAAAAAASSSSRKLQKY